MSVDTSQVLPKPPRLLSMPKEGPYDWREFDRWMQRLYLLLGTQQGQSWNVPDAITQDGMVINSVQAELYLLSRYNEPQGDEQALQWM